MLSLLPRTLRFKATVFMVALYAFTVLAPHAAMAFGAGAAHCLTQQEASDGHAHAASLQAYEASRADSADSNQPDQADEKGPAAACCGLFSASAMLSETREILPGPVTAASIQVPLSDLVEGQGPDRINRPPII